MYKRTRRRRRTFSPDYIGISIKKVLFILFIIIIGYTATVLFKINQFYHAAFTPSKKTSTVTSPTKKPEEKKVYNILLLGYAGGDHEGTYLTDTLMIVHLDMVKKKALLISLPRDIWVKIPTASGAEFHEKINAVYQMGLFKNQYPDIQKQYEGEYGAGMLVRRVIGDVVGLTLDNYVAIDFEGFKKGVDILGGVDVEVEKTFDDYEYPIAGMDKDLCGKQESDLPELIKIATESPVLAFPCRYEHIHFDAGSTLMDGATALKYVRSRHSLQDGSDFGRAARQQRFLEATKNKVLSIGFIPRLIPLLDEMKQYIRMDLSGDDIKKFVGASSDSNSYTIKNFVPSTEDYLTTSRSSYGGFILIPNEGEDQWKDLQKEIKRLLK